MAPAARRAHARDDAAASSWLRSPAEDPPMKLYFSVGACSLSAHIALREAGVKFELVRTSLKSHTLTDGSDYYAVNSKGQVPALELDDGERLTECPVILQYIADHAPASGLAPPAG